MNPAFYHSIRYFYMRIYITAVMIFIESISRNIPEIALYYSNI